MEKVPEYAKVLFDFKSSEHGDLPLSAGEVVEIVREVDANWYTGRLFGHIEGNFPKAFVELITVPPIQNGQKVFVALRNYSSENDDVLTFNKGDLILGLQKVDDLRWQGQVGKQCGIFLTKHMMALKTKQDLQTKHSQNIYNSNTTVLAKGRAIADITAQIDDELGLHTGDVISITKVIDKDFCVGECNGKSGMFMVDFVEIFEGSLPDPDVPPVVQKPSWRESHDSNQDNVFSTTPETNFNNTKNEAMNTQNDLNNAQKTASQSSYHTKSNSGSYNMENFNSADSGLTAYGRTLFPFIAENTNELTFFDNEIVTLIRHVDNQWMEGTIDGKTGIFPKSYIDIIVDCDPLLEESQTVEDTAPPSEQENESLAAPQDVEMYGRVVYDFKPSSEEELVLSEGDTVTILQKVDEHWLQAKHDDGRIGLCPVSYIELIQSDPLEQEPSPQSPPIIKPPDTVVTPVEIASKPEKPQIKPKPTLKPKPSLVRTKSEPPVAKERPKSPDKATKKETPQVPPPIQPRAVDLAKPSKPKPPRPASCVYASQKSVSFDTSFDHLVQNELKAAKEEAETRSRSSSDTRSIPESPVSPNRLSFHSDTAHFSKTNTTSPAPPVFGNSKQPRPLSMPPGRPLQPVSRENLGCAQPPQRPPAFPERRNPPGRPAGLQPLNRPPQPAQTNLGPKPVPQRKAPPRPGAVLNRTQSHTSQGTGEENLMEFSPDSPMSEEKFEKISELEGRLGELEIALDNSITQKRDFEQVLSVAQDSEKSELEENLQFYISEIEKNTRERDEIKRQLYLISPQLAEKERLANQKAEEQLLQAELDRRKEEEKKHREEFMARRMENRVKVIDELIKTEGYYSESLKVCLETFYGEDAEKHKDFDTDLMIGALAEVYEISLKLWDALQKTTVDVAFEDQLIGPCFIKFKEEMKHIYAKYCRNHDDVISKLKEFETMPEVQDYINRQLDKMRQSISVFDLGAILIKPVQRILKYPLLLSELLKSTEDDHKDKPHLIEAINSITDAASAINEYKRQKDLVEKYRKDNEHSLSQVVSKHSMIKNFNRTWVKIAGLKAVKEDQNFTREERRFKALEETVNSLVKDIVAYLDQLWRCVANQEMIAVDIGDYFVIKNQEVEQFCQVHNTIATQHYKDFRATVDLHVLTPLNRLLTLYKGPAKVIKKRCDKLYDYDNMMLRAESLKENNEKTAAKDLGTAKNVYVALNAQLLDELPKLYTLSVDIIHDCIAKMVQTQKIFHAKALDEMHQFLGLQCILGDGNILDTFNIAHTAVVDQLGDMSFIPASFNPRVTEMKKLNKSRKSIDPRSLQDADGSNQSDSQKAYVRQKYPNALFVVNQSYVAEHLMDLSFAKGCLVGVIKESDPMGDKKRWFVHNGVKEGFIPKHLLTPFQASPLPTRAALDAGDGSRRTSAVSPPPFQDLMDLNSPTEALQPQGHTPIPSDVDLQSQSLQSDSQSLWYKPTWEQANLSPEAVTNTGTKVQWNVPQTQLNTTPPQDPSSTWYDASSPNPQEDPPAYTYDEEYYTAMYSFEARSAIEASIREGQRVKVLKRHDIEGAAEWWLVEVDGRDGYVPANYLTQQQ